MKTILSSFALLVSVVGFSQTIGVRSLEPTHVEVAKLEVYDTTSVYLDFEKLITNPSYYNGQRILFSPDVAPERHYDYYSEFSTPAVCEMKDYPDTIWIKKRKKVREGDYYVEFPKTSSYKPVLVTNGNVRTLTTSSVYRYKIAPTTGFYTPRECIDGQEFIIQNSENYVADNYRREIKLYMLDKNGEEVVLTTPIQDKYFPSILLLSYIEKYQDAYLNKSFHIKDAETSYQVYVYKDISTGKYKDAVGEFICTSVGIVRGEEKASISYSDYLFGSEVKLFFKDASGNEFCTPMSCQSGYRSNIYGLNTNNYEEYSYLKSYYEVDLIDLVLSEDYYAQKEAERIAEENRIAEEQRQKAERKARLTKKYGKTYADLILQGKVRIGMTAEMCREAWGVPDDINRSSGSWGVHEQWCYDWGGYLYMENGKLTSIQN